MEEFVNLLDQYAPQEGPNKTNLEGLFTFRGSAPEKRRAEVYDSFIILGRQEDVREESIVIWMAKNMISVPEITWPYFYQCHIEVELIEASADHPYLAAYIKIGLSRLANLALKIDRIEHVVVKPGFTNLSGIFSVPLHNNLLEPAIRLLNSLSNPRDAAILGESYCGRMENCNG